MPNRVKEYYAGDDITFRGTFKIDGTAQTPDSGTAKALVMQRNSSTPIVAETTATIASTQVYYKYSNLIEGRFIIFLTAKFNSGADERTGVIEFIVKAKECH